MESWVSQPRPWMFGVRKFFAVRECPVPCMMFSNIPGRCTLDVRAHTHTRMYTHTHTHISYNNPNVSRHCQESPRGHHHRMVENRCSEGLNTGFLVK